MVDEYYLVSLYVQGVITYDEYMVLTSGLYDEEFIEEYLTNKDSYGIM